MSQPMDANFGIDFDNEYKPAIVPITNPAAANVVAPPAGAKPFRREIDLGDGSGKQVFEADTIEQLVDSLTQAQEHATRKIRELSTSKRKPTVDKQPSYKPIELKPRELTATEKSELGLQWAIDPDGTFERIFEAKVGASSKVLTDSLVETQRLLARNAVQEAEAEFLANHLDDYEPTPRHAKLIYDRLAEEQLPPTINNFEYAYQDLVEKGKLTPSQQQQPQSDAGIPPVQQVVDRPPVSISDRASANAASSGTPGVNVSEFSALSPDAMRQRFMELARGGGRR
jgi:hypothetical protein